MTNSFTFYLIVVIIIIFLMMLSQKLKVAYPIILVIAGLLIGMMPGVPVTGIDPELIFLIFLPPLLYDAAWNTSWKKFWYCRRAIFSFASIFILITSLVVALISSALIPGFTLAIGFLLGGIVSPPDAVSAASVFKNTKVPKNIATVVEGESLLNDASSLIVLRFALIAVDSGRFVFHKAAINFTIVIVMGIALGIVIGFIYYLVHSRLRTTANIDTVLMLTAPFVMYLVAEQFHISGVLSVVSGGLFLSSKRHFYLNHSSRRHGANVWSSIGLILNGLVFMLIGLELPNIVGQLGSHNIPIAIWYGLLISFVLIISRIIAAFVTSASTTFISQYITTSYSRPGWKKPLLFGWVGMRGVVSLAGALSLPVYLSNGTALPQRNLILFITFVVILVTLIFQGLTLPWLIRKLNIQADDEINPHGQRKLLSNKLSTFSLDIINTHYPAVAERNILVQLLAKELNRKEFSIENNLQIEEFKHVYSDLISKQRLVLHKWNKGPDNYDEDIAHYLTFLDLEEERLAYSF